MSTFWATWVIILIVVNTGITFFLLLWGTRVKIPTQADGTTGHVWAHGALREGVRKLPRWWFLLSLAMFVAAVGHLILYPGFGNFKGVLGWTSIRQLQTDTAANDARLANVMERISQQPLGRLAKDPQITRIGWRLFQDNCAACHGRQAHGNPLLGAPSLTDTAWLYGGDEKALLTSIRNGRNGVMPSWVSLGKANVRNVAQYVLSLSGRDHNAARAAAGKALFAACAACHGANGKGNPLVGAPDLTDEVWLYGGDLATITAGITDGHQGRMPAWKNRLNNDQIRLIAAWVYAQSKPGSAPATE